MYMYMYIYVCVHIYIYIHINIFIHLFTVAIGDIFFGLPPNTRWIGDGFTSKSSSWRIQWIGKGWGKSENRKHPETHGFLHVFTIKYKGKPCKCSHSIIQKDQRRDCYEDLWGGLRLGQRPFRSLFGQNPYAKCEEWQWFVVSIPLICWHMAPNVNPSEILLHDLWFQYWFRMGFPTSGFSDIQQDNQLNGLIINLITGWWFQPLWKILVSWDGYSQYMEKYNMFQTTNQIIISQFIKDI